MRTAAAAVGALCLVALTACPDLNEPKVPVATALSAVSGDAQTGTAGTPLPLPLAVKAVDASGNGVPNVTVAFAVTNGGGSLSGASAITNSDGIATVTWTLGGVAGVNNATAAVSGLSGSPIVFTATGNAGPPATNVKVEGDDQSAPVGTALSTRPSVKVIDAGGNAVSGVSVSFAVATGGGSISAAPSVTNAAGIATAGIWTLGTVAGLNTVTATTAGLASGSLTFKATGVAGAPAVLAVASGNNQTAVAGASLSVSPTVKVSDAHGNGVAGFSVAVSVASGGGSIAGTAATTNANGVATLPVWTLGVTAGVNTLSVTGAGLSGSPLTVSATGTAGAAKSISSNAGNGQTAVAGTAVATAPSVKVTDANGNAVAGATVTFVVATGGGTLAGGAATSNASGIASPGAWTLGTTAGVNTLTATAAGLSGSPVTFTATGTAGAATTITLNAGDGQSAVAGAAVSVVPSVKVTDAHSNPVAGASVTFAITSGGGALGKGTTTTDAAGVATAGSWTLGTTAGANTMTASAAGLSGSPIAFTATGVAGPVRDFVAYAGNGQTAIAGSAVTTPPSVSVTDANGNAVAGISVTFAVTGGGGTVAGASTPTNASGIAAATSWTLGTTAGPNTLIATLPAIAGSLITFTATGISGPARTLALHAGNNQSAQVGTAIATAPSVKVTDVNGNAVAGTAVTFAVASGGGTITGGAATTNASGIATVGSWTLGPTVGANSLTATASGLTGSPVTFTATGTSSGTASIILLNAGNGQSAVAGTAVPVLPSVKVTDAAGNPVAGTSVTFAVASGGGSITGAAATSNGSGIATVGSWTLGTGAGANTLTATSAGLTGSPITFNATGTAGPAVKLGLTVSPSVSAQNRVSLPVQPVVQIQDVNGNAVSQGGVAIAATLTAGGGSLGGTTTISTTAAGTATYSNLSISGTVGPRSITFSNVALTSVTASVTLTAGAASSLALNAGNGQTANVGAPVPIAPSVIVRDADANPVSGVNVTFAVASGGGSITGPTQATNASGIATVGGWTLGPTAGGNSLTATATGLTGSPVTISATATTTGATTLTLHAGDAQTATAGTAVGILPAVRATDAGGSPVAGVSVSFVVASGGGSITNGVATTNASGIATVGSWTLGNLAGVNTLTATSAGLTGSPVTFTANGTAGPPVKLGLTTAIPGTVQNRIAFPTQPVVQVQDANGNGVAQAGTVVTITIAAGGGTLGGTTTATTSVTGAASFSGLSIAGTVGPRTLNFSAAGLATAIGSTTLAAGAATSIALNAGNDQSATVGTTVPVAPSVIVKDADANGVAGVSVTFTVVAGGGSVAGSSQTTNSSGVATVGSWTLGATPGVNTLLGISAGLTGSPVNFNATGVGVGVPTTIAIDAGNGQTATAGSAVSVLPAVKVTDVDGNAVAGVSVTFALASGGGSITGATPTTNGNGIATLGSWTLGTTAGPNSVTATATGLTGSPLTFTANGVAGVAAKLALSPAPSASAQNRIAFVTQPTVQVQDVNGNSVSQSGVVVGAAITAGGGVLNGTTSATTTAGGSAAFTNLSIAGAVGSRTLSFTSPGLVSATASVVVTAGSATSLAINAGNNQTATAGAAVATAPSVIVKDADANVVSGVSVTFAVASGSGNVTGASQTTDGNGIATVGSWTLGSIPGSNTLTASSPGLGGSPATFTATGTATSLSNGVPVTGISSAVSGQRYYSINVPAGATTLTVSISGGTGDADLYLRAATLPTLSAFDCRPYLGGNAETCTMNSPAAGTWYILLDAFAAYSGVTLTASYSTTAVNFTIDGLYLTQSTQSYTGSVPLVAGRAALLRVFVKASQTNANTPTVRVRLYVSGSLLATYTITAPAASVPTSITESVLGSSWNVSIPASQMQQNLSVLADVDPTNAVSESSEADNFFPISGTAQSLDVRSTSTFSVSLVPVLQQPNGRTGDVTTSNKGDYTDFLSRVYPIATVDAAVHSVYSFSGSVPASYDSVWSRLLSEIRALRTVEGSTRYYYGVLKPAAVSGGSGLGYIGLPAAIGVDWTASHSTYTNWRAMTFAHETGHNFGRNHIDCGGPSGPDLAYPYPTNTIGVHGYDLSTGALRVSSSHADLMSYCSPLWISDYTYKAVMTFRAAGGGATMAAGPRRSLLVWGRVGQNGLVLEPSFEVTAIPSLPTASGPYAVQAFDGSGRVMFSESFAVDQVDHMAGEGHFAFTIPLPDDGSWPTTIRLSGAGRTATRSIAATGAVVLGGAAATGLRAGPTLNGRRRLQWDAQRYPAALVRDPVSGEVLAIARGGSIEVQSRSGQIEVTVSDGVTSVRSRIQRQ